MGFIKVITVGAPPFSCCWKQYSPFLDADIKNVLLWLSSIIPNYIGYVCQS